jgi:hypothetical protein
MVYGRAGPTNLRKHALLTEALPFMLCVCRPDQSMPGVQYPTHVPLNILQKGAVASLSAIGALIRYGTASNRSSQVSWLNA